MGNSLLVHVTVILTVASLLENNVVFGEEYCEYETFSPSCANDEIILISEAIYGRMSAGKCIRLGLPDSHPELGCSTNVLAALSQHCSGRQSCSYRIHNLVLDYQGNCPPSSLRSYLEVTYTCLKVFTPTLSCQNAAPIPITNIGTEGYIASFVTQKTGCGDSDNPWLLTVDEGQRINITLIDFASSEEKENDEDSSKCIVYATIRDGMGAVRSVICGGGHKKIAPVFMSTSNRVEIHVISKAIQHQKPDRQFVLKYSVEGCADPDLPDTMWVKRFLYEALVGCKAGLQTTWLLRCTKGVWEGQVGICSSTAGSVPVIAQSKTKENAANAAVSKPVSGAAVISRESEE